MTPEAEIAVGTRLEKAMSNQPKEGLMKVKTNTKVGSIGLDSRNAGQAFYKRTRITVSPLSGSEI